MDNVKNTKDSKIVKIEDDLKIVKSEPKLTPNVEPDSATNIKQEEGEETMSDNVFEKLKQDDESNLPKSSNDELNEIRKRRLNNLNL